MDDCLTANVAIGAVLTAKRAFGAIFIGNIASGAKMSAKVAGGAILVPKTPSGAVVVRNESLFLSKNLLHLDMMPLFRSLFVLSSFFL